MLQRFYNLCRKPIIEVDSTSMIETSENILRRTYRKRTDGHIDFQIDALILPDDMVWPSFLSKARCRFHHIYFQRQSVLDANRRKITLKRICNRSQVVWSGAPGIGKSSETNYIFMLFKYLLQDTKIGAMVSHAISSKCCCNLKFPFLFCFCCRRQSFWGSSIYPINRRFQIFRCGHPRYRRRRYNGRRAWRIA